jgi:hypothetical protein
MKNWLSIAFVAVILPLAAVATAAPASAEVGKPAPVGTSIVERVSEGVPPRVWQGSSSAAKSGDVQRYAARERTSPGLQKFKGGDGVAVYIGGSALAIALFIVLLIIIL